MRTNRISARRTVVVTVLLAAGGASAVASAAMVNSGSILSVGGASLSAATGGVILVPAFAISGIVRGVNNSKVNNQIESWQTLLPIETHTVLDGLHLADAEDS